MHEDMARLMGMLGKGETSLESGITALLRGMKGVFFSFLSEKKTASRKNLAKAVIDFAAYRRDVAQSVQNRMAASAKEEVLAFYTFVFGGAVMQVLRPALTSMILMHMLGFS